MKNKKGFTLIEMLVVVLIIGILAAIALPQYQISVEKSRVSEALINLKHAREARVMDFIKGGKSSNPRDIMELSGGKWNDKGWYYCTKHFLYEVDDNTFVGARRCKSNDACTRCEGKIEYDIYMETPYNGINWTNNDQCDAYTDKGLRICNSLDLIVYDYRNN